MKYVRESMQFFYSIHPDVTVGDAGISWNPSEFKVLDKRGGFDGKPEKFYDLIMICSAVWNNDLGNDSLPLPSTTSDWYNLSIRSTLLQ